MQPPGDNVGGAVNRGYHYGSVYADDVAMAAKAPGSSRFDVQAAPPARHYAKCPPGDVQHLPDRISTTGGNVDSESPFGPHFGFA